MDYLDFFDSDLDDQSEFSGFNSDDIGDFSDDSMSDFEDSESEVEEIPVRWTKDSRNPISKRPFSGPNPGPTVDVTPDMTVLDFFYMFFPTFLITHVVEQTNIYAVQKQRISPDPNWRPVTEQEMKAWLGLRIYMSIVQLPQLNMYWSKDSTFGNHFPRVVMPRDRFLKIQQYIHLNNRDNQIPRGQPGFDKMFLVRPILDEVTKLCQDNYNLNQNVSIDEAMVKFRGRLEFRQYLPAKPTKYGIKVWMLADPANGYVGDLQVYTGKHEGNKEVGLAHRVVTDLTERLYGRNHIVNMDNYFTGIPLFEQLLENETYARGTVRVNRKGLPQGHLNKKSVKVRGQYITSQKGELLASIWMDKKPVLTLSTAEDPSQIDSIVARKKANGDVTEIQAPATIPAYNKYMNGVDRADQLRTEYSTYRKAKKWWTYLFWFLFDTATTNAFVAMRESAAHQKKSRGGNIKSLVMIDFRMDLAKSLVGDFTSQQRAALATVVSGHFPTRGERRGRCRQCTKTRRRREVFNMCIQCNLHLCAICFKDFHTELVELNN